MIFNIFKKSARNKNENADLIGDGKAEFLGAGTYEDYENELEYNKSWRKYVADTLKIDRYED